MIRIHTITDEEFEAKLQKLLETIESRREWENLKHRSNKTQPNPKHNEV